jgi:quinol monooxygenase YgiN
VSACVIVKLKVDPEKFKALFENRPDELRAVSEEAKTLGALHHFFAGKEGEVVIVDEWDESDSFLSFFDNPTVADFMKDVGLEGAPEVEIYEILDSPDRF